MPTPNILYIHSHDTGRLIQPYGHAVPTPYMQRLAEQGVLFRQAFCAAPTCSPSRAALLTGEYPHQNGMLGLAHRGFEINDYDKHLVRTLKRAGYHTAMSGMQHAIAQTRVEELGFDELLARAVPPDIDVAHTKAIEFLDRAPRQPFFLDVGFQETHRRFPDAGPEQDDRYCLPPATMPDTPQTRRDMAGFKASARLLDDKIGQVLGALDRNGLADNTLVICTTDHGPPFPRMKCNLTDQGMGVMLIVRGPGGFAGGRVIDAMVSHLDLFPTVCDLAGIDQPDRLEGESLLPLIAGERESLHEEVFAEVNFHASYEPQRAVRTERYKYLRYFDDRTGPVYANCDGGATKKLWLHAGWERRNPANEALYDLVFDPHEQNNLIDDPALSDVARQLRDRLEQWMQRTADPLLKGPVPAPPGARLEDPDSGGLPTPTASAR